MAELVFATNNKNKLLEIKHLLEPGYRIYSLAERGLTEEIPEDYFTLEENAFQKAEYVFSRTGFSCFADDTGLEIDALGGEPGVFSARYSRIGYPVYPAMEVASGNIRKVLEKMEGSMDRTARFRTVIALIHNNERFSFEGVVKGIITLDPRGKGGFGYDPIFIPEGEKDTFAQMPLDRKNRISHRAIAVHRLIEFLRNA